MSFAAYAIFCIGLHVCTPTDIYAASTPHADGYLGEIQRYKIKKNESLIEIARKFDLGYNSIVEANPGVDPFIPQSGSTITIPTAWILPKISGIPSVIINLPEFRLYYLPNESPGTVVTFPLGIGDEWRETPLGLYTVTDKMVNPAWYVPGSIRAKEADLPRVVPPGPKNPMGTHALRLSRSDILIHGTNRPWGIGRRSSHGCLRLYPEDIVQFFKLVPKGMRVLIVNQPVKIGNRGNRVFIEVHRYGGNEPSVGQTLHMLAYRDLVENIDFAKLIKAVKEMRGLPVDITLER